MRKFSNMRKSYYIAQNKLSTLLDSIVSNIMDAFSIMRIIKSMTKSSKLPCPIKEVANIAQKRRKHACIISIMFTKLKSLIKADDGVSFFCEKPANGTNYSTFYNLPQNEIDFLGETVQTFCFPGIFGCRWILRKRIKLT